MSTTLSHPEMLNSENSQQLLRKMLLVRRFEEKCAELYNAEKIRGFLHLYIGEEAVATGVISQLAADDAIVATYREHGHALVRGISPKNVMAEMYGKAEGCSRGRGGSMHIFDAKTRFYGGNAIVGGGLPLSVGLALADSLQRRPRVTVCFFGEGAVAEGEFHESMNLAALWKLPVLFLCENNLYAMGTALSRSEAQIDLSLKAKGYGVASTSVDGMDITAVIHGAKMALNFVRSGNGPYLLECRTYRFRAHSMFDPELYRQKTEVEEWKRRDPILLLSSSLKELGWLDDARYSQIESEVASEVLEAVRFAEAGSWEPLEDLSRDVYTSQAE